MKIILKKSVVIAPTTKSRETYARAIRSTEDTRLDKALDLMKGSIKIPLGQSPERDRKVLQAWSRGE